MNKPRAWNRKNISKYVEIYIKSDVKKIISSNKKKYIRRRKMLLVLISSLNFQKILI
jgi:hypothetical protein